MYMSDLNPSVAAELASKGVHVGRSNSDVIRACSIVIVATKPDAVCGALMQERESISSRAPLVISIAAGLSLASLEASLPAGTRTARVMPNTPALVGASASAFAMGSAASELDANIVNCIFGSIGTGQSQTLGDTQRQHTA